MNFKNLRDEFAAFAGGVIERSKMVNTVDPQAFNYSLEDPIVRHYGQYLHFDHPWSFAALQPFIRPTDFSSLVRGDLRRQSIFEVGAMFELSHDSGQRQQAHAETLGNLIRFLTEIIGLDPDSFVFTVFGGGTLAEAARNSGREIRLVRPELSFPADVETPEILRGLGFSDNQIIAETSLDTFLAEFPAPIEAWAGYRCEIYYDDPDIGCLEIGTDEQLGYRRLIWDGAEKAPSGILATKDIVPHTGTFVASGFGLERVLMVTNGLKSSYECDHIAPIFTSALERTKSQDKLTAATLTDAIRVLQLVIVDGFGFANLPTRHIKNQFSLYCRHLDRCLTELGLTDNDLLDLAMINAEAQPWEVGLYSAGPRLLEELAAYRQRVRQS